MELLFDKQKKLTIELKDGSNKIKDVICEMEKIIKGNKNLFTNSNSELKPGIIVLYNDADWEIYEKENTVVSDNDTISFISTLHGG